MQSDQTNSPAPEANKGFDFSKAVKAFVLLSLTTTGLLILATRSARASRARKSSAKSMKEGSPANYATRIRSVLGVGMFEDTNEPDLRRLLTAMPSYNFYRLVADEYEKQFSTVKGKASLEADMRSSLTPSELSEMMLIIQSKPKKTGGQVSMDALCSKWAERLKAAFDLTYGYIQATDEDAILAVFHEIPTQAAWKQVQQKYQQRYNTSLEDALKGELEFWEYDSYMKIIRSKK